MRGPLLPCIVSRIGSTKVRPSGEPRGRRVDAIGETRNMPEWLQGDLAERSIWLAGLLALAGVAYGLARLIVVRAIQALVRRSTMSWDDALMDAGVFVRMAHVAPLIVVYLGIDLIPGVPDALDDFVRRVSLAGMVAVGALSVSAFLRAINEIYSRSAASSQRPIKGYVQIGQILLTLMAAIIVVSILLGRSPWILVSGVGALTAVLMLIFKDTILSLVASLQIASNDMVRLGDWIEMPDSSADGDVIDIALHTVKVQNWDKTITMIPTYRFISDPFKNWRGMSESGGRRIKRSIHIDVNSIRFLDEDEVDRLSEWALLRDYLAKKKAEIDEFNASPGRNAEVAADIRRLTNVGTLRAYIEAYLRAHPEIHHDGFTLIVRQLQPGPTGLPIEIYCFSKEQDWTRYEGIQSDILDHILALLPEFGLTAYQQPAGVDFERLVREETRSSEGSRSMESSR